MRNIYKKGIAENGKILGKETDSLVRFIDFGDNKKLDELGKLAHINININIKNYSLEICGVNYNVEDFYPVKKDHAITVIENALDIAEILKMNEYEKKKVFIAALLHDVMKAKARKYFPNQEKDLIPLLKQHGEFYKNNNIFVDTGIQGHTTNYWITHAPESAFFAFSELGITDEDILKAIAHHQTGRYYEDYLKMSDYENIIMLADYIDEKENEYEKLAKRCIENTENIFLALITVLTGTVQKELFRTDKPGGPTPNGNLLKLWEKMTEKWLSEPNNFKGYSKFENYENYWIPEYWKNELLIEFYFNGYLESKEKFRNYLEIYTKSENKFYVETAFKLISEIPD